jgi:DNA transformation protein
MAAGSNHFVDYLLEQLAPLRGAVSKNFFGGVALVHGDTQFAMVMGSELYFVVDDLTRPNYERMGSECFSYATKKGRVAVRKYYAVPAGLIEDEDQLVVLARESIRVASALKSPTRRRKEATSKSPAKRKKTSSTASKKLSGVR